MDTHGPLNQMFFGIVDTKTGRQWSRNGWGPVGATPDLYQTKAAAQRQIDKGKIALMLKFWPCCEPEVITYMLTRMLPVIREPLRDDSRV